MKHEDMLIEKSKNDILDWLIKFVFPILIGLLGKASYELRQKRSLSFWAWVGIMGLSIVAGYISSVICSINHLDEQSKVVVPMVTLFGEKIFEFLFSRKFWDIVLDSFKAFLNHWTKNITKSSEIEN